MKAIMMRSVESHCMLLLQGNHTCEFVSKSLQGMVEISLPVPLMRLMTKKQTRCMRALTLTWTVGGR